MALFCDSNAWRTLAAAETGAHCTIHHGYWPLAIKRSYRKLTQEAANIMQDPLHFGCILIWLLLSEKRYRILWTSRFKNSFLQFWTTLHNTTSAPNYSRLYATKVVIYGLHYYGLGYMIIYCLFIYCVAFNVPIKLHWVRILLFPSWPYLPRKLTVAGLTILSLRLPG